jgi:hypothetical protein
MTTAAIQIHTIVTKGNVRYELRIGDRVVGTAARYTDALAARGQYVAMAERCEVTA